MYGMYECPMVRYALVVLDQNNVEYEYIDITDIQNLKEFLKLRDTHADFEEIRGSGSIGIPAFVLEDGSIEFDMCNIAGVKDCQIYQDMMKTL